MTKIVHLGFSSSVSFFLLFYPKFLLILTPFFAYACLDLHVFVCPILPAWMIDGERSLVLLVLVCINLVFLYAQGCVHGDADDDGCA